MDKKLRIVIASVGRFHVLDLARELHAIGHDVTFISIVPQWRADQFGLPRGCLISLFWICTPLIGLTYLTTGRLRKFIEAIMIRYLDVIVAYIMPACDVFIGMSHVYVKSERAATTRYGALTICERGSTHAQFQQRLMKRLGSTEVSPATIIRRELECYKRYDFIAIPALHVKKSFEEFGVPTNKLIVNPYAVDLEMFAPSPRTGRPKDKKKAIFAGRWGLRKGADLMVELRSQFDFFLSHVGPTDDFPLPLDDPQFNSTGPVDQLELPKHYADADFAILISREEGLALVQAQALACGLPLLCSQHTGGNDLKKLIDIPDAIVEVDINNLGSIRDGFKKVIELSDILSGTDLLGDKGRQNLSWRAYAERYSLNISHCMQTKR